jgi:Lipocalin-like domain
MRLWKYALPFILIASQAISAQPPAVPAASQFVGTWRLISRVRMHDGKPVKDFEWDRHSIGYIMYDTSGHMAVQIMATDRTGTMDCSKVPDAGSNNPSICDGYVAYFGTYTIDEANRTVTHHVEGTVFARDVGKHQVRHYEFSGNVLQLSVLPTQPGEDTYVLRWERVAPVSH